MIKLNQKDQLKPYIDLNAELRQKAKNNFQKDLFKLKNFPALNLSQQRRRNFLAPEPNYYTTKFFMENLLTKVMKKTQAAINITSK